MPKMTSASLGGGLEVCKCGLAVVGARSIAPPIDTGKPLRLQVRPASVAAAIARDYSSGPSSARSIEPASASTLTALPTAICAITS